MADSSRPGKFLTLLTLERSSFRDNATLQATFFTRSICQNLNEPLNVPQTRKRPKKERTNKQLTAEHYTPAAHARARGNYIYGCQCAGNTGHKGTTQVTPSLIFLLVQHVSKLCCEITLKQLCAGENGGMELLV